MSDLSDNRPAPDGSLLGDDATRSLPDQLLEDSRPCRTSKDYKELLDFLARLRNFAPFNAMLLQVQPPGLNDEASAQDWRERFGRLLKDGARPLLILWPFGPVALVADVQDTEGMPLPEDVSSFATPAIALGAYRVEHPVLLHLLLEEVTCILTASVGVMDRARRRLSAQASHGQRLEHDFPGHSGLDIPLRFVGDAMIVDCLAPHPATFRLPSLQELKQALKYFDFQRDKAGGKGSHEKWTGPDNRAFPVPRRDPVGTEVFRKFLHHMGIDKATYVDKVRPNL